MSGTKATGASFLLHYRHATGASRVALVVDGEEAAGTTSTPSSLSGVRRGGGLRGGGR
jgi:hypothetical protein